MSIAQSYMLHHQDLHFPKSANLWHRPNKTYLDYLHTHKNKFQRKMTSYDRDTWLTLSKWNVWRVPISDLHLQLRSQLWTQLYTKLNSTDRAQRLRRSIEDRQRNLPLTDLELYLRSTHCRLEIALLDSIRVNMMIREVSHQSFLLITKS
jgi:hypothetical protein